MKRLATPTRIALSSDVWGVAAILAGLRVRANDPIRAADRNRGEDKNWLADIGGTLGEIVALRLVNEICDAPVAHHPIDFERSVDDVDLVVDLDDGPLRLETKAHVLAPGKRWFMVNQRAHERSLKRGAGGYVPLITALGAPRAYVGSLLTTSELSEWGTPTVFLKDPAIGVRLDVLATSHFNRPLPALERTLPSEAVIDKGDLAAAAARAGANFDAWRRELPDLVHLSAKGLRDAVVQTRARIEPTLGR